MGRQSGLLPRPIGQCPSWPAVGNPAVVHGWSAFWPRTNAETDSAQPRLAGEFRIWHWAYAQAGCLAKCPSPPGSAQVGQLGGLFWGPLVFGEAHWANLRLANWTRCSRDPPSHETHRAVARAVPGTFRFVRHTGQYQQPGQLHVRPTAGQQNVPKPTGQRPGWPGGLFWGPSVSRGSIASWPQAHRAEPRMAVTWATLDTFRFTRPTGQCPGWPAQHAQAHRAALRM